ncbi:hypothetical protein BCR33DRAFT_745116 [Rhizoclosmatium globosum]|uniref:Uncharacterized protein n=1 Tax=Rhizoclosmatium globosum TaxID=329046 RepID=A0A1Y2B518_9FUNG|nr:hypothetical protein BCR33DRAFT_745116 [Rhizoclosmatium globosum]|eukprot:ORY29929.1 hypothetical protein BCR33DRAFT_745116 [Rhizoclosmatium globosum]
MSSSNNSSNNTSPQSSNESIGSNSSTGSGRFTRIVSELGKKLSRRTDKESLVGKNILKGFDHIPIYQSLKQLCRGLHLAHYPGQKIALEKEKQQDALNRKLALRPEKVDLKLRNILKGTNDSLNKSNEDLDRSLNSFEKKAHKLKSCLRKRPSRNELEEMNIIKSGGLAPAIVETHRRLSRSIIEDTLESKLRNRPDMDELASKNILFCETVEVHTTFRKSEYNRRPDGDVTFKHLTPQLKVQIRNELNTYKKNEMEIHEDAQQNTCFHY